MAKANLTRRLMMIAAAGTAGLAASIEGLDAATDKDDAIPSEKRAAVDRYVTRLAGGKRDKQGGVQALIALSAVLESSRKEIAENKIPSAWLRDPDLGPVIGGPNEKPIPWWKWLKWICMGILIIILI